MNVIFVGIGIFSIGIIIFALMLLLRGDGSREQKLMQYFFLGALVQNVGYLLELTAPTLEAAIVSVKIQYSISLAAIEQQLKKEYEVIPVNSGARALQYLRRERPDLILLDIWMAQKDGIETMREIRQIERGWGIPAIMLTSKQDKATIIETSKLGIFDYVLKPFKGEDLHNRIDRALKK